MTTAIVFVLSKYLLPDAGLGVNYCLAHDYEVKLVKDDWEAAMGYLHDGTADVLVIPDESHLDPDRTPRIEVVAHHQAARADGTPHERTRLIRRNGEG